MTRQASAPTTHTPSHTPGPWSAQEYTDGRVTVLGSIAQGDGYSSALVVADVIGHKDDGRTIANARLLASAPDLLAALTAAAHDLDCAAEILDDDEETAGKLADAAMNARAAIRKATER